MKIAVTGGSGFIGAVLVPLLQDAGHELRLLTRDQLPPKNARSTQWTPGDAQGYAEGVDIDFQTTEYIQGDMLDKQRLHQLVAGMDAVIHLAAMISMKDGPDEKLIQVNVMGTRLLAEAARQAGVGRFIHVSSAAAFQQAPYDQPLDENKKLVQSTKYSYPYSKASLSKSRWSTMIIKCPFLSLHQPRYWVPTTMNHPCWAGVS